MNKMKIDIWSDVACPFCYIGKRKMEKALSLFPDAQDIKLVWHSYELDPDLPKGAYGKSYYEYLAEMNGYSIEDAKNSFNEVLLLAKEEGLKFNPDKIIVTNTADALRLIKLANKYDLATEAEEELFNAYFVDGKDISDKNTLTSLGVKIGIPQGDIIRSLDSFEYFENIKNDMQQAEEKYSLEFIPFYLLNSKTIIQGSVAVEKYLETLYEAYNDWKTNGEPDGEDSINIIKGKSCSIDGTCSI